MTKEEREAAEEVIKKINESVVTLEPGHRQERRAAPSKEELWRLAQRLKDNPIPDDNLHHEPPERNRS